jgi:hypothetical protein
MVGKNRLVTNPFSEGLGAELGFAPGRMPETSAGAGWP